MNIKYNSVFKDQAYGIIKAKAYIIMINYYN